MSELHFVSARFIHVFNLKTLTSYSQHFSQCCMTFINEGVYNNLKVFTKWAYMLVKLFIMFKLLVSNELLQQNREVDCWTLSLNNNGSAEALPKIFNILLFQTTYCQENIWSNNHSFYCKYAHLLRMDSCLHSFQNHK